MPLKKLYTGYQYSNILKKLLFVLLALGSILSGCKKDSKQNVNITSADLAAISAQLKGTWVFPVKTLMVVDSMGNPLLPGQNLPAAAFAFDGSNTVTIRPDPSTIQTGTYAVSANKDGSIEYPCSISRRNYTRFSDHSANQQYTYYCLHAAIYLLS